MIRFLARKMISNPTKAVLFFSLALGAGGQNPLLAAVSDVPPTTAPAAVSPTTAPSPEVLAAVKQLGSSQRMLQALLGRDGLATDARRKEISPQAVPLLHGMLEQLQVVSTGPAGSKVTEGGQQQTLAMLAALDDESAVKTLREMSDSKDEHVSLLGLGGQLIARWYVAGRDVAAQTAVADELEKLDRAHPADEHLTVLTARMSQTAADKTLAARVQSIATDEMSNPTAAAFKNQIETRAKRDEAATSAQSALVSKPLTISGKTIGGKDFTTADWKGKVVLVDFWAVWCGPCCAEMPQIKKLYEDAHAKGLEIVGVSNDFDADKLDKFVADQQLPWPQLFDVDAAANQRLNPISDTFKIDKIPVMFLIDRKGIVRSVTPREDLETLVSQLLSEPG